MFGLAFNLDMDDLRESPALNICLDLAQRIDGCLSLVEPNIKELPASLKEISNRRLCTISDALKEADVVPGHVDHKELRVLTRESHVEKVVIDTRGILR